MACLSSQCIAKGFVFGSVVPSNNDLSPSPDPKPSIPIDKKTTILPSKKRRQSKTKLQQKLTLIKIERAIGAGSYRDSEPTGTEQRDSILKGILPNNGSAFEGPVEKQLRETGEWLTHKTEGQFRSSGKSILMFTFKWVLPIYIVMFLVTCGIVKLPFTIPLLDDLLM